ncbi:hypothetical protein COLO4_33483 [Corchorus olitorius]|uniref:Uncharacterized protein n=1 Tax=Corchorus olitorius TaxID=93759 RepID=A0A1R3GT99_9ROSI|nr:hypothetical protein COLO4_33483 [Corchorus olitorius]
MVELSYLRTCLYSYYDYNVPAIMRVPCPPSYWDFTLVHDNEAVFGDSASQDRILQ